MRQENSGERRALEIAEGAFDPSIMKAHIRRHARALRRSLHSSQHTIKSPNEAMAIHLAESSFDSAQRSTRYPHGIVATPGDEEALRLAEGHLTPAEEKEIANGGDDVELENPVGSTNIMDLELAKELTSASERTALRLAEGRISGREAREIADGGEGRPRRSRRTSLRDRRGRRHESEDEDDDEHSEARSRGRDEFRLPDDESVEKDIVYGRPGDHKRAAEALLQETNKGAQVAADFVLAAGATGAFVRADGD